MKIKIISLLVLIFSLFGTSFLIPQAFAGGVGTPVSASECSGPSLVTIFNSEFDPAGPWIISDFIVSLDPNFGPWQKNLVPEAGVPIQVGNTQILFDVEETIMVGPGISFTDWHEVIVTPDWIWEVGSTVLLDPQGTIIENGNEISITFDNPVNPGDLIEITKTLQYVGQGSEISDASPLVLLQNPTSVECDEVVGGEVIPIEITSLALAGVQTNAIWILTLLITIGGAGLFYFKIK